jgi:DNA-binding PadR family transcriptional regulator
MEQVIYFKEGIVYELIILGQLMRAPAHGYLIASIINDIIGPYARVSNGRLYPLLASLEKAGLIVPYVDASQKSQGNRQLRSYQITEEGRRRFHELMMNTTSSPGEYQKLFAQKVAYLYFLKPTERLRLIDHYINYCQAHLHHLSAEADDVARESSTWDTPGEPYWVQDVLDAMQHMSDQWTLELEWARRLHEKELSRP